MSVTQEEIDTLADLIHTENEKEHLDPKRALELMDQTIALFDRVLVDAKQE